ncbi:MAG: hypothetical protein AB7F89_06450 [Pirellulaceae bacterium]
MNRCARIVCSLVSVLGVCSGPSCNAVANEGGVAAAAQNASHTHQQSLVIEVADVKNDQKLEDFCTDAKGRILALVAPSGSAATNGLLGDVLPTKKVPTGACEIRVFDAAGKLVDKWPVGFHGQAINVAPNGTILVGGDGYLARFDNEGKKLHQAESPQMIYIRDNPAEMRERAEEQLESDRAVYGELVKQLEEQLAEFAEQQNNREPKAQAADEPEPAESASLNPKVLLPAYKRYVEQLNKQKPEDVLDKVISRAKWTHSIAASDDEVFVTCPAMAGYGYGVWRTNSQFGAAKEIIKSLAGCCGQMDVQCCQGELYVCENSRHRVVRYDREGKELGAFGKRDREGAGENFGGCCNPMNLCFNKQGDLYVSESNGVVKHFTSMGEYKGIVGVAKVQPGCKNSCVAVTADDSRLFYIDIEKSQIIVLARSGTAGQ